MPVMFCCKMAVQQEAVWLFPTVHFCPGHLQNGKLVYILFRSINHHQLYSEQRKSNFQHLKEKFFKLVDFYSYTAFAVCCYFLKV